ncbi:MAG: hypothetical protein M3Q29_03465 [Chloroflexota bacterium]|nr:hypothetical protein [Chloroflexota bacterium]
MTVRDGEGETLWPQAAALGLFIVALTALGTLAALAAPGSDQVGPVHASNALAARRSGVLHVRARHLYHAPNGALTEVRFSELWLDRVTGDARHEERSYDGDFHSLQTRRGLTRTTHLPLDRVVETHVAAVPEASFLKAVEEKTLSYANDMLKGRLQPVGSGTLGGRRVNIVQRRVDGGEGGFDTVRAWVDAQSGLPLMEVAYRTWVWGLPLEVETELTEYELVEETGRAALPQGVFDPPAPPGAHISTHRYLTPDGAARLQDFPLYWLGPRHGRLPLFGISRDERNQPGGEVSVAIVYAHPHDSGGEQPPRDEVSIVQRLPLTSAERQSLAQSNRPAGGAVVIQGRPATLFDYEASVQLELTLGDTFITLGGADRRQVLEAANKLRRLN